MTLSSGGAHAFEFDTGNPDLSVRWDNTAALQLRESRREPRLRRSATRRIATKAPTASTSGDAVANRLDLLTELDLIYKKRYGVRVSAAGWYDDAYGSTSQSNPYPPLRNIPSYVNNQYSNYTQRFYDGPSGELLDAFVFGGVDIGDVPVTQSSAAIRSTGASRCS